MAADRGGGVGSDEEEEDGRETDDREGERRIRGTLRAKKFQIEENYFQSNFSVLYLERMVC